ncbi:MAG: dockerin type I domain-containing protein [Candidatus Bathyarchaeia archaeon]
MNLSIETDKQSYELGERIDIYGNLTLDYTPVTSGLIAFQIKDPKGLLNGTVFRTVNIGDNVSIGSGIEIVSLFLCDVKGVQIPSMSISQMLRINATLKNTSVAPRNVLLFVSVHLPDNFLFLTYILYNDTLAPGMRWSANYQLDYLPSTAIGVCSMYGSALSGLPENGGFPLCMGKNSTFLVTGSSMTASLGSIPELPTTSSTSMFSLSYYTNGKGGWLGNYTIYASSYYPPWLSTDQATIMTKLSRDLNGDNFVNMLDMYLVAIHYGQNPSHPNWDPRADVDKNDIVNMFDLYLVAIDYGKWGKVP